MVQESKKLRILLADDHQIFLDGLKSILEHEDDIEVVETALDGTEVFEALNRVNVDIIVLDLSMPKMDGMATLHLLKENFPGIKAIVLSYSNEGETIHSTMRAGAKGYVLKNRGGKDLVNAIRKVANGSVFFPEEIMELITSYVSQVHDNEDAIKSQKKLSPREIDVISCLMEGMTSKMIAEVLFIATSTVETHKNKIKEKTGLVNAAAIAAYGQKQNITPFSMRMKGE